MVSLYWWVTRNYGYVFLLVCFFFFKQKTAYEMRISDWSSDVCSSDLSCSVSDTPLVWQWVRSIFERSDCAPSFVIARCHSTRAARSFAASMKKFMPIAKKKDRRPAKLSMSRPLATPYFTSTMPLAMVQDSPCTRVQPASHSEHIRGGEKG